MNLNQICSEPISKRDLKWEQNLLNCFPKSEIFLQQDTPIIGPDGFSYMAVSDSAGTKVESSEDFLNWCFESGTGIVLNLNDKNTPDYVFSYGMIWNYLLRGSFLNDKNEFKKENKKILIHELSEGYLPKVVRENLSFFLKSNKIDKAEITLVSQGDQSPYEILFYFENLQDLEEKDQKVLLESISWFLPLDYNIAWATSNDPNFNFMPL